MTKKNYILKCLAAVGLTAIWLSHAVLSEDVSQEEGAMCQQASVSSRGVAADSSCQRPEGLERINTWWERMSEQKPVKCRDRIWQQGAGSSPPPEGDQRNLVRREMVFKTCDKGSVQYFFENNGECI